MTSHLNVTVALALALLTSIGCSSDSGGSEQTSLSGVPRPISDDGITTAPPDSEAPASQTTPATTETPASETSPRDIVTEPQEPDAPATAPTPQESSSPAQTVPPESAGVPADAVIDNLVGTVLFEFGFSGSSDVFTLEKRFAQDSIGVDSITGAPFIQAGAGTTIVTRCVILPGELPYFCAEATAESSVAVSFRLFHFNLDSTRNGTGNFEFCPTGTAADACTVDAFATPDGRVTVSVDASNAVTLAPLQIDQQRITTDLQAHHLVAEQAQSAPDSHHLLTGESVAKSRAIDALHSIRTELGASATDR